MKKAPAIPPKIAAAIADAPSTPPASMYGVPEPAPGLSAAYSTFPTRAFRLESVQIRIGSKSGLSLSGGNVWIYNERTYVTPTTTPSFVVKDLTAVFNRSSTFPLAIAFSRSERRTLRILRPASGP